MKKALTKKLATVALATTLVFSSVGGASAATYKVKSGDTLSKIAKTYGTTYQSLMKQNDLKSTMIRVGQTLTINSKKASSSSTTASKASSSVVTNAKKHLGTRYVFGGSTPKGFDCSGYVSYVLNQSGKNTGRLTAAGFYSKSKKVSSPRVGDLVFFSGTYKAGVSHIGIYVGNGKMISATSSGVKIDSVKSGFWGKHFTGYGRI